MAATTPFPSVPTKWRNLIQDSNTTTGLHKLSLLLCDELEAMERLLAVNGQEPKYLYDPDLIRPEGIPAEPPGTAEAASL